MPAERVAVFDNDGTLWSEKPIPIQLDFTLFRMAELAEADPTLAGRQPYKSAVEHDYRWLGEAMVKHYHGDDDDLHLLMAAVETAFGGHDSGRVQPGGNRLAGVGVAPATAPPVPQLRVCAHDRAAAIPGGKRVQLPTSPQVATVTSCAPSPNSCTGYPPSG